MENPTIETDVHFPDDKKKVMFHMRMWRTGIDDISKFPKHFKVRLILDIPDPIITDVPVVNWKERSVIVLSVEEFLTLKTRKQETITMVDHLLFLRFPVKKILEVVEVIKM